MIDPQIAWTLRRLLTGESVNGEVAALPEPFRTMADRLARVETGKQSRGKEQREALAASRALIWEKMLAARPDRDELVKALAGVDPLGPRPGSNDPAEEWRPLRYKGLPPAEPFPVDILPEPMARLIREGADAIGCPPDFLAVPALAVAAGVIGRSVALLLKEGYFADATVYAGCVGPPSDGKTPALKVVAAAVRRIDEGLAARYEQDRERWENEASAHEKEGKKHKPPPPPKPQRIDVDDITMETVPVILADNPRGLVMVCDELTAFILGMNQFKSGKGNDRQIALKIWSGEAIKKDRVANLYNAPVRCPHPCMTIVGGLTPDMLGSMVDPKGRADGFLDRFLLTYPEPLPVAAWSERGVSRDTADAWCDLVGRLWARPMNAKDGRSVPQAARLTPDGMAAWRAHHDAHAAEMNAPDFNPSLRGPWGKLREYAGRLVLILACIEHAADPIADPAAVPDVDPQTVAAAWRLVAYFKAHARRVYAAIDLGPGIGGGTVVKAIVDWLRSGGRPSFSEHEIKQARRWINPDDLPEAFDYLTTRNAIRPQETAADASKGGRPPSPVYLVNPALLDTQNPQNPQNGGQCQTFECSEGFE